MTHPSSLSLDLLHLGRGRPADREHAQACPQCSAYLARLAMPVAVPDSVRSLPATRHAGPLLGRWLLVGGLGAAVAAGLLLLVARPGTDEVRSKGTPTTSVFVLRDGVVMRWDGLAPVRAGDALQLEVQPEGMLRLQVFEVEQQLFEGELTAGKQTLPISWKVDPGTDAVELRLVFSKERLTPERGLAVWSSRRRDDGVWATTLRLPRAEP
jgi:hypothetical protein